jgi:hypothetical protein
LLGRLLEKDFPYNDRSSFAIDRSMAAPRLRDRRSREHGKPNCAEIGQSAALGQTRPAAAEGWAIGFRGRPAIIPFMVPAIAADEPPATPTAIAPTAKSADSLKTIAVESALAESHRAARHGHGQRKRRRAREKLSSHLNLLCPEEG